MIVLFTDFSLKGPYVGQMKAVINHKSPNSVVIDLMHDVPTFAIQPASYLLASLVQTLPKNSVFLAVIDPGVGSTERKGCVIKTDHAWFIGPDNGLFDRIMMESNNFKIWEINKPDGFISNTFHGRDIFAPVAAQIDQDNIYNAKSYTKKLNKSDWPDSLQQVIYCDHYGNVMTGVKANSISTSDLVEINDHQLKYARTFSEVPQGQLFWYINSNQMLEFSVNQGRADQLLKSVIGNPFNIKKISR